MLIYGCVTLQKSACVCTKARLLGIFLHMTYTWPLLQNKPHATQTTMAAPTHFSPGVFQSRKVLNHLILSLFIWLFVQLSKLLIWFIKPLGKKTYLILRIDLQLHPDENFVTLPCLHQSPSKLRLQMAEWPCLYTTRAVVMLSPLLKPMGSALHLLPSVLQLKLNHTLSIHTSIFKQCLW